MSLVEVDALAVEAPGGARIVDGVSFAILRGEALGLVGPSGCGKSTVALALLGYLRPGCRRVGGTVRLDGVDLFGLAAAHLQRLRGRRVALVPQDPGSALTPTMRVGDLVTEAIECHGTDPDARARALELFGLVNLPDPAELLRRYPHELSGGQRQRVAIAAALAGRPDLLVLDEPTTGLDPRNRARVLELLRDLRDRVRTSMVMISHDRDAVAAVAERVLAMAGGRLVPDVAPAAVALVPAPPPSGGPRLEVAHLTAGYRWHVPVLADLSLVIEAGTTVALVGESGSGKSTLARVLAGLHAPDGGSSSFGGRDLAAPAERRPRALLRDVQIVFQNPDASLNPRHTVAEILARPFALYGAGSAEELLAQVKLGPRVLPLYPAQLSGGERQRVAIARAFAARPKLVICDEVVSALDADARGAVLALLLELQRVHGTSYLFITHDRALAKVFAHRVVELRHGRVALEN